MYIPEEEATAAFFASLVVNPRIMSHAPIARNGIEIARAIGTTNVATTITIRDIIKTVKLTNDKLAFMVSHV
jgi:hypothetical protein